MPPKMISGVTITTPMTGTSLLVSWEPEVAPILGYNVYRSLSPEGTFSQIAAGIGVNFYLDTNALQNERTDYWYKVSATDGAGEGPLSAAATITPMALIDPKADTSRLGFSIEMNQESILSEMVRRNSLLLRRGGEITDIYIRLTAGQKCTNCYDPVRNQPKFPNCPVCFGTSYQGGYQKFASQLMKIEPYREGRQLVELGGKLTATPRSWILSYPLVRAGDIVVRQLNNRRYEIQNVDVKLSRGIITRQEYDLIEVTRRENPELFMAI